LKLETSKSQNDLYRGYERGLTIGFHLEWTWTHGCVPRASGPKIKVRVVGPDDITEGDVDPPECATCHYGCGKQLCSVAPEGKEIEFLEFGDWSDKRLGVTAS
jgi:hypothetical protein